MLRSNLMVALADIERPTVVVTSALEGEGKTSVCAGLTVSMAAAGLRIVAVDLDLRHPDLHRRLNAHNEYGVTEVLLGERPLSDCLQRVQTSASRRADLSAYVLATGRTVANPTELLGSGRTGRMLDVLSQQTDIVLIDTPPVLPVADTLVIGRLAAGAVLVVEAGRTPVPTARRAKDALIRSQGRLLGVVLSKLEGQDSQYGYGYGYGADGAVDDAPPRSSSA